MKEIIRTIKKMAGGLLPLTKAGSGKICMMGGGVSLPLKYFMKDISHRGDSMDLEFTSNPMTNSKM